MPADPLTSEPLVIMAGETLAWRITVSDYPASASWTLKYALQLAGTATITTLPGTADGDTHVIAATAAATATYTPGAYVWTSFVENGAGARHVVGRGTLTILASPLAALGTTHATRVLALIEAAIEGRIPNGLETTNIDGQELQRIPAEALQRLRDKYRREVFQEQKAALAKAGVRQRNSIGIRFRNP